MTHAGKTATAPAISSKNVRVVSDTRVRVEVLGPLRVVGPDGRDLTPVGGLQRRLLSLLVLCRGRVVSADRAADVLWPSQLPADPSGALQNHVSRLRQVLPTSLIESVGEGYRLDPTRIDLDADRIASAIREATAIDDHTLDELTGLLGRWHGPAYPELADVDEANAESTRLGDLRTQAIEALAEHRLTSGRTEGLVAELNAMVTAEPLRERPRALLMATLASAGRRVEALRVYDDFRRVLGDELGIEPSPLLAAQHAALLGAEPGEDTTWTPPTRLPHPTTSLLARDELADHAIRLVESNRLISLVGLGGVGKTRLLIEIGHRLRSVRTDRPIALCELSAADETSAASVVAAALGIDERPGMPLVERLASVLGDTEIIVLVDNCEHVLLPIANLIEHLLTHCPNLTAVATSRERLRIPGEQVCAVPTLPIDGDDAAAAQLFVERARAVLPAFEPDAGQRACIAEIVRRLDGLPLAIELAAARLHTHDVFEVAAGLDHRFSLLTSGYRTTARHESLRAAVSWSFGLLEPPLQDVFASLSVFSGSFSVDDASAVCALGVADTTAALSKLVERSLVMRVPERRYMMLETLRAFGNECLLENGRRDLIDRRHAEHFVRWAEGADARLLEPGGTAIAEIDAAIPELHSAFGWLVEHSEAELAGRLVAGLLHYGFLRLRPDVLMWAKRIPEIDPEDHSPVAPMVWVAAAYSAWMDGDVTESESCSARALTLVEEAGGDMPSKVASTRGTIDLIQGRLDAALHWYRRALELAPDDSAQQVFVGATELLAQSYSGDPTAADHAEALIAAWGENESPYAAYAWYCLGEAELANDPSTAQVRFARAIDLAERTGSSFASGLAMASKLSIDSRVGDPLAAAKGYRVLIDHWRRAGMWSTQWTILRSIAGLLERLGRARDAAVLVGAILGTSEGHSIFGADEIALRELGERLRAALGDDEHPAAFAEGAALAGDAAVEHALRTLTEATRSSDGGSPLQMQ